MKKIILILTLIIFTALFKTDSVKAQTCPSIPSNTGSVTFSTTTTAGTYRVWSRMKSADATNNSFYLKIDNNCAVLVGDSSQISSTIWTWVDYQNGNTSTKINATLTAGTHVITLYGNEIGVSIDKVLLTKNIYCVPVNFGTNCPLEVPTSAPTITPTLSPVTPTLTPTPVHNPTMTPTMTPTPTPTPVHITSTPTITPTLSPSSGSFSQYIEAENFTLSSPMTRGSDISALSGQYISPITGSASTSPLREANGSIYLPSAGIYYLWARIMGPTDASDALYLGFDNSWDRFFPSVPGVYEWVKIENSNSSGNFAFNLAAGSHIIQVGHGEINARLDTVFVTNDPHAGPTQSLPTPTPSQGGGDQIAPAIVITAPSNFSVVKRRSTVAISANVTDNKAVSYVEFYVNDRIICRNFAAPYTCRWNVPDSRFKFYKLTVKAYDFSQNSSSSTIWAYTTWR